MLRFKCYFSYALLCVLSRLDANQGSIDDAFPILEWLLGQQNSNGGFVSTPDTTVALTALREFSKKMKVFDRDSKIDLRYTYSNAVRRYAPYYTLFNSNQYTL